MLSILYYTCISKIKLMQHAFKKGNLNEKITLKCLVKLVFANGNYMMGIHT